MAARRKAKSSGVQINIKPCPTCPPYTPGRMVMGGDKHQIVCARCERVLKEWEPPVIWVNGEPVPVRFRSGY